jgi:hypothetical protein
MSEETAARPCQWPECEEAATKHAERMGHLGIRRDETGKALLDNQVTRYDLCGKHFEELKAYGGVIELPSLALPAPENAPRGEYGA